MAVDFENLHHMPTIKVAMTPFPFFVGIDDSIDRHRHIEGKGEASRLGG